MREKTAPAKAGPARRRARATTGTKKAAGATVRAVRRDERPPYVIPTMGEVRALPWNGLTVASTFAGGGGSSTGYRMAGYRVAYANEFVDSARETYAANKAPAAVLDGRDVRQVTAEDILERTGLDVGELDVLDGSPPCSAFSTAGKRHEGWGVAKSYSDNRTQVVDDLFFEYARLVAGLRPRVFVAENVSGLVKGSARGYFLRILEALKAPGYRVSARLLDASLLGVPQARQRLIFVGVREDLRRDPAHPAPFPYRYALEDVAPYVTGRGAGGAFGVVGAVAPASKPAATVLAIGPTGGSSGSPSGVVLTRELEIARAGLDVDTSRGAVWRDGVAYDPETGHRISVTSGRFAAALPGHTLRSMTLAEVRAVSGFPADYALHGTYAQRWERLGRSVPPLMMRAVASTVAREILDA